MLFPSSFVGQKEQRLLHFAESGTSPEPVKQLSPELQKLSGNIDEIRTKLVEAAGRIGDGSKENFNTAVAEITEERIKELTKDAGQATKELDGAVMNSYLAYKEAISTDTNFPDKEAQTAELKRVYGSVLHVFEDGMHFHEDARKNFVERLKQEGFSPEDSAEMNTSLAAFPDGVKEAVVDIIEEAGTADYEQIRELITDLGAFKDKAAQTTLLMAVQNRLAGVEETKDMKNNVRKILDNPFAMKLLKRFIEIRSESTLVEDREKIQREGAAIVKGYAKASQEDRELIEARLMMMGADVKQSDLISDPPKIVPFEGDPKMAGFNRFMGMLQFALAYLGKIKGLWDKAMGKKGAEAAPAGSTTPDKTKETQPIADDQLMKEVREKGYTATHKRLTDAHDADAKALNGDPTSADVSKQVGLMKLRDQFKADIDSLAREQKTKSDAFEEAKKTSKPNEAQYETAKTELEKAQKKIDDNNVMIEKLNKEIEPREKSEQNLKSQIKQLEDAKKNTNEQRRQVQIEISKAFEACKEEPLKETADGFSIFGALNGRAIVTPPSDDEEYLQCTFNGPPHLKGMKDTMQKLGIDASDWDVEEKNLKNPSAFVKSLQETMAKLQRRASSEEKTINDLVENKHLTFDEAKTVVHLKQEHGIPVERQPDGSWKFGVGMDVNNVESMMKVADVLAFGHMEHTITKLLIAFLNEGLKDVTKPLGQSALRQISGGLGEPWRDPKLADEMSTVLTTIEGMPKAASYEPFDVKIPMPNDAQKAAIKAQFPELSDELKTAWSIS
ncbi:MAG: hypothetical protein WCS85_00660 [Candidatus Peribacteraceae bacterium]